MSELKKLEELIDKYDVISFDIFDTLLLRNVLKPIDIFRVLEIEVKEKYYIDNFCRMRIEAEQNSRTEKNQYETTLDEIYDTLLINSKIIKEEIKKMEINLEKEFLTFNPFMKLVYDYAVSKNKKIVCISDMYLPEKIISDILNNNGYKDIKVYVSNEYHKHKSNMTLYELVWEKEKFEKENWLHIGDNYYSDYEQARNFGISSYHYKNVLSRSKNLGDNLSVASSIIFAISNNAVNNGLEVDYWGKFGIINAAPLYYAFANWSYKESIINDNLHFWGKDVYIINKIVDKIKTVENNKNSLSNLYTSRIATQLPSLIHGKKTVAIDILCGVNFLNYYNYETIFNLIINNMMMFEFIFSSPEGSLVRYEEQDNKVIPVLSENKDYIKEVSIIQDAAINIIDKYLKYYKYTSKIDSEESLLPYKNYLETRDYNDVKMVSTLFTNVGYSGNEFSFINSFTKEDIENNIMDFFEGGIIKSLWEKTFVIEGINSAEEFNSYMAYINNKYKKMCKIRLLKKFKPRNVLRVLKRKVKAIIKG